MGDELDVTEELSRILSEEMDKCVAEELAMTFCISWLEDGI